MIQRRGVLALVAVCLVVPALPAFATSGVDRERVWEPVPASEPLYDVQEPSADLRRQSHYVAAADGVELYVETWLPAPRDGVLPPERVPTILLVSPYAEVGVMRHATEPGRYLVQRGYAYAQMHARGTGESGGCFEDVSERDADDVARVIEYLGRDAPWSDGSVGGLGKSQEGARLLAAALFGDSERTGYLQALVLAAPVASRADTWAFDGVPYTLNAQVTQAQHLVNDSLLSDPSPTPEASAGRVGCQPAAIVAAADISGDVTPFLQAHDLRRAMNRLAVPTFMIHGHRDTDVEPLVQAGMFDRIPASTPKVGLFGVFDHDWPDRHSRGVRPEWERADFLPMVTAWFDQHVKGLDTGTARWPVVQVQGTDGQWRAAPDWPATGGPVGQLVLGAAGGLGVVTPTGSTSYREGAWANPVVPPLPGTFAVWETDPLPDRLEITGQPVLDVWVVLDRPDAHLAALIETFDAQGNEIPFGYVRGFRSMRHLDPLVENRFWQAEGRPAPVGVPVRVPLRFHPTDLVVPKGGRVRVTLTGSLVLERNLEEEAGVPAELVGNPTLPSFSLTGVRVLHDCAHLSALRFVMPERHPDLLEVRERGEVGELSGDRPASAATGSSAGDVATRHVCGQQPVHLPNFGQRPAMSG